MLISLQKILFERFSEKWLYLDKFREALYDMGKMTKKSMKMTIFYGALT